MTEKQAQAEHEMHMLIRGMVLANKAGDKHLANEFRIIALDSARRAKYTKEDHLGEISILSRNLGRGGYDQELAHASIQFHTHAATL